MSYTEIACSGASATADTLIRTVLADGTVTWEIEAARLTLTRGELGLAARTQ